MIDKLKLKETILDLQIERLNTETKRIEWNQNLINYLINDILKITQDIHKFKKIAINLN